MKLPLLLTCPEFYRSQSLQSGPHLLVPSTRHVSFFVSGVSSLLSSHDLPRLDQLLGRNGSATPAAKHELKKKMIGSMISILGRKFIESHLASGCFSGCKIVQLSKTSPRCVPTSPHGCGDPVHPKPQPVALDSEEQPSPAAEKSKRFS